MTANDYKISWHAPEYEHREHSADWYWAVIIITIALGIAFIISGNILLSVVVILGVGLLLVHSRHKAPMITYHLSRKGLRAGKTLYPWETLESFWILDATEHTGSKILLTSRKPLMPHIVVPLSEDAPHDEIRDILTHMIHEEHQIEPLPDRVMRKLGF